MELGGLQTTPRSLSILSSPRRSLCYSWTSSIAGLSQLTTINGFIRLTSRLSILRDEIPTKEWCKLLAISSKLGCKDVRTRAINELTAKKSEVSPVDRIELGNNHNIPQWLPEAYADVFVRQDHLTVEEGEKLGLKITVKVLKGRDTCKRNRWGSVAASGVTQLVKVIFPPTESPVSPMQRRKGVRRSIYDSG
jgi:hypothetical protein